MAYDVAADIRLAPRLKAILASIPVEFIWVGTCGDNSGTSEARPTRCSARAAKRSGPTNQ